MWLEFPPCLTCNGINSPSTKSCPGAGDVSNPVHLGPEMKSIPSTASKASVSRTWASTSIVLCPKFKNIWQVPKVNMVSPFPTDTGRVVLLLILSSGTNLLLTTVMVAPVSIMHSTFLPKTFPSQVKEAPLIERTSAFLFLFPPSVACGGLVSDSGFLNFGSGLKVWCFDQHLVS